MYRTIGDGGNREGLAAKWLAQTPVSAYRMATYGHGEIQILNATHAHWSWHTNPDAGACLPQRPPAFLSPSLI